MRVGVDLDALEPGRRGVANAAIVIPADRHQPLADIGAGRDRHAQALRGVLMHIAPVGAEQETPLGFAQRIEIAQHAVAHAIGHTARGRRHLRRQHLQQRRLARTGLADDRQHLAGIEREGDVAAGGEPAEILRQVLRNEQRLIVLSHAASPCAERHFRGRDGRPPDVPRNSRCRSRRTCGCRHRR